MIAVPFSHLALPVAQAVILAAPLTAIASQAQMTCRASLVHYDALAARHSVADAVALIGCEGRSMSERAVDGVILQSLAWDGNGATDSNTSLLFADDAFINRQQIGLR